jgi:hypothetical protein
MKSIRSFAYATILTLTMLNIAPKLASAQEPARGTFTLSHEVHWQKAIVPAGDYQFSFSPDEASGLLRLREISGGEASFMLLVLDVDKAKPSDVSGLLLETTSEGSYARALQLPEFGMTLRFGVPSPKAEKRIAQAATAGRDATTTMAAVR